ncbi:MAG: hypothetical protein K0R30_1398 [Ornithinibacter sp.]|nr:hypothetical protein [Ornithinibacter sp.]
MQAGEHVGDDAVWARVLAAEKARQEAASGRQNGHESAEIIAARRDAGRVA